MVAKENVVLVSYIEISPLFYLVQKVFEGRV